MSDTPLPILTSLAAAILEKSTQKPLLVAINGKDASGKTILADNLAAFLRTQTNQPVVQISFDKFLNESAIRNGQFESEGQGSYDHAFNYAGFIRHFLQPISTDSPRFARQIYDLTTDTNIAPVYLPAPPNGIFLIDGLFLYRRELIDYWDLKILLEVPNATLIERGAHRDAAQFGGYDHAKARFMNRYLPSQDIYFHETQPESVADIIIDNTLPEKAFIKTPKPLL